MIEKNQLAFDTRCIHAGQEPDPTTGAVMMPIYATSTYAQESPGVHKGYEYARSQNPTRMAFERCIADLEGGSAGFAFGSGLAATATVLDALDHGAHIVASDDLYGGTRRLFERVRAPLGRARHHLCRPLEPRRGAGGAQARDEARLDRDADQSAAQALRPRGDRRRREGARAVACRRQHLRQPLRPAPAGIRLRPRRAFDDEIPQRPFRHGRRRRRRRPRRRSCARSSPSCRTPSARSRARSTAFWRCAA